MRCIALRPSTTVRLHASVMGSSCFNARGGSNRIVSTTFKSWVGNICKCCIHLSVQRMERVTRGLYLKVYQPLINFDSADRRNRHLACPHPGGYKATMRDAL